MLTLKVLSHSVLGHFLVMPLLYQRAYLVSPAILGQSANLHRYQTHRGRINDPPRRRLVPVFRVPLISRIFPDRR